MAKETNIRFKIDMTVDGKQQATELGMQLSDLEDVMGAIEQSSRKTQGAISSFMTNMEYLGNAIGRLQSVMNDLTQAYAVQQEAETQLATAMRNTMGATDAQIQSIKELCSAQQELGVIGDEVQLQGAKQMAVYLNQATNLERLLPIINDVAVAQYGLNVSGQQLAGIADAIGKAMMGQDRGLRKFGISLTDAQKELLKTGTESERAALLVELLGQKFGGANEEIRKTSTGQVKAIDNWLGDLKENLGQAAAAFTPYLNTVAAAGMSATSFIQLAKATGIATAAQKGFVVVQKALAPAVAICSKMVNSATVAVYASARGMNIGSVAARRLALGFKTMLIASGVGVAIWAVTEAIAAFASKADEAKTKADQLNEATDAFEHRCYLCPISTKTSIIMNTYDDPEATRYNNPDDETTQLNDTPSAQAPEAPQPSPSAENEDNQQATTKKSSTLKQAAVAAGSGLLVGAIIPPLMGMKSPDSNEDTTAKPEGGNHSEVLTNPEWVDDNIMVATTVGEDMTFGQAFATARAEVGPGGCFEWHGNVYGTYTAEEWNALSPSEQAAWNDHFSWNHIDHSQSNTHHADAAASSSSSPSAQTPSDTTAEQPTPAANEAAQNQTAQTTTPQAEEPGAVDDDDIEIISVNHTTNQAGGGQAVALTENGYEQPGENHDAPTAAPEVEIIGVVHDSEMDANIAAVAIDGQEVILIDVDSDMTFDYMAADTNGNGELDPNEVVDISGQNLTVSDLGGFSDPYGSTGDDPSTWNNDTYLS